MFAGALSAVSRCCLLYSIM